METALSTIRQLPFSKHQVELFSTQIKDSLIAGQVEPLELAVYFKSIEKTIESVKETLSTMALNEAEKYGKGAFDFKGAQIQVKELGTKYDFSQTNDLFWHELQAEKQKIEEKLKQRETMLKSLTGSLTIANEDTGEIETIYPPIKKSTTGISITIK